MARRAVIIHGWDGQPDSGWLASLRLALEQQGFNVTAPALPHPDRPTIADWVATLARSVGQPDSQLVLIGHSIGCQTILRYLAQVATPIAGALLVAGFSTLHNLATAEEKTIAAPWLVTPIDTAAVRIQCPHLRVYLSDNDAWVPLEPNRDWFTEQLGAEVVVCAQAEHFTGSAGEQLVPELVTLAQAWTAN